MEKTRMPIVAGIMDVISGPLGFISAFIALMGLMYPDPGFQILMLGLGALFGIAGILAIVGGLFAFQRRNWGLAFAGSIAALSPLVLPGIVAIVLTVRSKKEFQLGKHVEAENVWGLLCYILGWISGLVLILIKRQNKFVRFHAMQSIIVFGTLTIVSYVLSWILSLIYFAGEIFDYLILLLSFVLWIVLMVTAYQGKKYKLPLAGNLAEKWAG